MKEFETRVLIVCIILCAIIIGLGIVFPEEKPENNVVVEEEVNGEQR